MRKSIALYLIPLLCFHVLSETAPMVKREKEALYSVIQSFVGNWWNGSELYPDPCGNTPIQGISCDVFEEHWYITALSVGPVLENSIDCSREAEFNPAIFALEHLTALSFFDCFSFDQRPTKIPDHGWENLSQSLETLEFRSNRALVGDIPRSFGRLTKLESLVLSESAMSGELPPELGNLANLRRLSLSGNQFSGEIPDSVGRNNLRQLLILDLGSNSLTGPLPGSLGGLNSLLKLDLSNNLISGQIPVSLGELKNLTLLDLSRNKLSGELTKSLQGLVSVKDMILCDNPLGGNLMEFGWENLRGLESLDLSNMELSGGIPESVAGLKRLRFLALRNNRLTGRVPGELEDLPGLNALYLNGNNLTGELKFSQGFYERLGRRFGSWGNPGLCCRVDGGGGGGFPPGVKHCGDEEDSVKRIDSFGLSASSINGFCWAVVAQEVVVVFLLALLL